MSETTYQERSHVFLEGDPNPIGTDATVEQIAGLVADHQSTGLPSFIRLPGPYGDALVRPDQVVAILPTGGEDE